MVVAEEIYPPGYEDFRERVGGFLKVFNRMEVEGQERLPGLGEPGVLCPNHDGYLDPVYLMTAVEHRFMRGLGQEKVLNDPLVGKFLRSMGIIPVPASHGKALDKDGAAAAVKLLSEHLKRGELCTVFPEGTVKFWIDSDALKRFRPGGVKAAAMAGAPVIPVGMYGTRWTFPNLVFLRGKTPSGKSFAHGVYTFGLLPVKVAIAFGEPMAVDPAAAEDHAVAIAEMERVRKAVFALRQSLKRRYF